MRYTNIIEEIDAKVNEMCGQMAEEMVRKAKEMQPIPTFSYCRPELGRPGKMPKMLKRALKETREQIRFQFGLPGDRS